MSREALVGCYDGRVMENLKPLLDAGVVRMTDPDNPRSSRQKYVRVDGEPGIGGGKEEQLRGTRASRLP